MLLIRGMAIKLYTVVNSKGCLIYFTDSAEGFTDEPSFQEISVNETLSLTCRFDGVPTPSVVWLHDNSIIREKSDPRVSILIDNANRIAVLNITNATITDIGIYSCAFTSLNDTFILTVTTLIIICKPN